MELPSREKAAAELFHNKLEYHLMVRLFYVFLTVLDGNGVHVAQRHKLKAVVIQMALVSRINSLLLFGLLMGFVGKK